MKKAQQIAVENGGLILFSDVFPHLESERLMARLQREIVWQQPQIRIAGRSVKIPRLQAWHGDESAHYRYSGLSIQPEPWTETLLIIKQRVEEVVGSTMPSCFNSVLVNRYRSGQDSVGWHSDDEAELGVDPTIASLSLGQTRVFRLQHKQQADNKIKLELESGSLLLMYGELQHFWRHQLPKSKQRMGERINLTFRYILP